MTQREFAAQLIRECAPLDLSEECLPKLPMGYAWGKQSGDYRPILRDGKPVAQFGGVACKASSDWQRELDYQIARYEYRKTVGLPT